MTTKYDSSFCHRIRFNLCTAVMSLFCIQGTGLTACPDAINSQAMTVGGPESDFVNCAFTASNGDVLIGGDFCGTVDFDPGIGEDIYAAAGVGDGFISRYTADGDYLWTIVLQSEAADAVYAIAEAVDESIVVAGLFSQTVDFDPSEFVYFLTSNGVYDAFIASYTKYGSYQWAIGIGGTSTDAAVEVGVFADGSILCLGGYNDIVDFDPSDGVFELDTIGTADDYMLSLDPQGGFRWVETIGNEGSSTATDLLILADDSFVIAGGFGDLMDFDPSEGEALFTSIGEDDAYVSAYSATGAYQWTRVMGGTGNDYGTSLSRTTSGFYVAGAFRRDVDFDPGEGVDIRSSQGVYDAFVSKFTEDGDYLGTYTAGGFGFEYGFGLSTAPDGSVYLAGQFGTLNGQPGYSVDFNPNGGGDIHTGNGDADIFVTRLNSDLSYGWTWTAGGIGLDTASSLAATDTGGVWIGGEFSDTVDFDPEGEGDLHTSNGSLDIFMAHLECADEPPPCDGDVNADNTVDPLDAGYILSRFGCPVGNGDPLCDAADANLDTIVDPLDVGYVMSRFGECP